MKLQIWIWGNFGLCSTAIELGKNLFSEDILDFENFTCIFHLFELEWATMHKLCWKSGGGCLPVIAHVDMFRFFSISPFSLAQYFTLNDSDHERIWSLGSRSCTAGYPGCPVLSILFWVTYIGEIKNVGKQTIRLSLLNCCHVLWEATQLFCHLWWRNTKIMDKNYFWAKFGHASFNVYKLSFRNIKTYTFISRAWKEKYDIVGSLGCEYFINKNLSSKGAHPLVAFIARQEE